MPAFGSKADISARPVQQFAVHKLAKLLAAAFRVLLHLISPNAAKPLAKSRSAAGSGVVVTVER